MTQPPSRPVPPPDHDSAEFWASCGRHELQIQTCKSCGMAQHYPRAYCTTCRSDDLAWRRATGTGVIYSFTVVRRPPSPAFASLVPYIVALVDLSEGPRMMTNIVGENAAQARIGAEVTLSWVDVGDTALPVFELVGS